MFFFRGVEVDQRPEGSSDNSQEKKSSYPGAFFLLLFIFIRFFSAGVCGVASGEAFFFMVSASVTAVEPARLFSSISSDKSVL